VVSFFRISFLESLQIAISDMKLIVKNTRLADFSGKREKGEIRKANIGEYFNGVIVSTGLE